MNKKPKLLTIHVVSTNNYELTQKWGFPAELNGNLFIRCNSKGIVNWEKSPVYSSDEIESKGNFKILEKK